MKTKLEPGVALLTLAAAWSCDNELTSPAEFQPPTFDVPGDGDSGQDDDPPPAPPVTATIVGPEEPRSSWCVELGMGEWLASVSPDGHAWLVSDSQDQTTFRILDPLQRAERSETLALGGVATLLARSGVDAEVVAADGRLWRLEEFQRVEVAPPQSVLSVTSLCGTLAGEGVLLAEGSMFSVDSTQWQRSSFDLSSDEVPDRVLPREGACVGLDNALWATSPNGTLWRIGENAAQQSGQFNPLSGAAATADEVMMLHGSQVSVGENLWRHWTFDSDAPERVSGSGSSFWLASTSRVIRFASDTFTEISAPLSADITALEAHPAGVWVGSADELCHLESQPIVQIVDGVVPFAEVLDDSFTAELAANGSLRVLQDGNELETQETARGTFTVSGAFDTVGWHTLSFEVDSELARVVHVRRVPQTPRSFATDVVPIFDEHCAQCHGVDQNISTPIADYASWVEFSDDIRVRVVNTDNMPPAVSRTSAWGSDDVAVISEWLEGGLLP